MKQEQIEPRTNVYTENYKTLMKKVEDPNK